MGPVYHSISNGTLYFILINIFYMIPTTFLRIISFAFVFSFLVSCSTQSSTQVELEGGTSTDTENSVSVNTNLQSSIESYIHQNMPNSSVSVTVEADGRVTLDGTVASLADESAIEQGISSINGVTRVRNRLKVAE